MKSFKSKSFEKSYKNGQYKLFWTEPQHLNNSKNGVPYPQYNFEKFLKQIRQGILKLFVVLKFLFHRYVLTFFKKHDLPWFKISFLSLFALLLLKDDFKITINLPTANAPIAKEEQEPPVSSDAAWFSSFTSLKSDSRKATFEEEKKPVKKTTNPFAPVDTDELVDIETKAYIRRFHKVAITEMNKFGVPASIKMAQGIIESRNGKSRLAKANNNHFGMKCFSTKCPKGHCANFNDDHHKDFFRKYDSSWASWRHHSKLLANGRYKKLQQYGSDYKKWAKGLKSLGYATDRKYDKKLIRTIEKYKLYYLDQLADNS